MGGHMSSDTHGLKGKLLDMAVASTVCNDAELLA